MISYIDLDLQDNFDEIPRNEIDLEDHYGEYSDEREYPILPDIRTSTETQEKELAELNMVSSEVRKDPSCVDQKVWCKFADCSLENVKRNCQKTCNNCP